MSSNLYLLGHVVVISLEKYFLSDWTTRFKFFFKKAYLISKFAAAKNCAGKLNKFCSRVKSIILFSPNWYVAVSNFQSHNNLCKSSLIELYGPL